MDWFLLGIGLYTILACFTNIFLFGKHRKYLYFLIPLQLFLGFSFYSAIDHIKGYATHSVEELSGKQFTFISYFVKNNNLYLIAVPPGGFEPRMYLWMKTDSTPQSMNRLGKKIEQFDTVTKEKRKGRTGVIIEDSPYDEKHFKMEGFKKLPDKQPDE